jgi:predicted CopG family antitoxin
MAKVISIDDDVYAKLKELKGTKSFSEIIMEMLNNKKGNPGILKKYLGILSDEEAKKIEDEGKSSRHTSEPRK